MDGTMWKGKRVLVTGADGFVGSHLVEALLERGARVIAGTRPTSRNGTTMHELHNLGGVKASLEGIFAVNIAQSEITKAIVDLAPDVILHLAAEAYVPRSFDQPGEVFAANALGTLHILEASRQLPKLARLVVTSSSEVYGTAIGDVAIHEEVLLQPTSPYAASKVAADRLAYSYRFTYGLPISIIRPFNTYGPRHTYDVIPKFIKLALAGSDLTVHGTGEQRRDFTYVDDTVQGFLAMGLHPAAVGEVVNFGSGTSHSILHVAQRILALSGSKSRIVHTEARPAEVTHLLCDASKAKRLFGWQPLVDLDEGLRRNIAWERARQPAR